MILSLLSQHMTFAGRTPNSTGWIQARCPFHDDTSPSFGFNVYSGYWNCFRCGAGTLKQLLTRFGVNASTQQEALRSLRESDVLPIANQSTILRLESGSLPPTPIDPNAEFIDELVLARCLPVDPTTIGLHVPANVLEEHQVGFDPQTNRILWPIRDRFGRLVAISGRAVTKEDEKHGKYRVYTSQHLSPFCHSRYTPQNRNHFYNGDRVFPLLSVREGGSVLLVEGFKACLWAKLHLPIPALAMMGARITDAQVRLLERFHLHRVYVFLDANTAGILGTDAVARRLSRFGVYIMEYPPNKQQPDDLSADEITQSFWDAIPFTTWRTKMSIVIPSTSQGNNFLPPKKSGGSGVDYIDVPSNGTPIHIRLVNSSYTQPMWDNASGSVVQVTQPFMYRKRHSVGVGKNITFFPCIAGPDLNHPRPCLGCYYYSVYDLGADGKKQYLCKERHEFLYTAVQLGVFKKEEVQKEGKSYQKWVYVGYNRRTPFPSEQGLEWGMRGVITLPATHNDSLAKYGLKLAGSCAFGGDIFPTQVVCPHCGATLIEVATSGMTDEQVSACTRTQRYCTACGRSSYPSTRAECSCLNRRGEEITACKDSNGNHLGPRPVSIFDVDLCLSKSGTPPALVVDRDGDFSVLPFAQAGVQNWPERWAQLNQQADLEFFLRQPTIQEQADKSGLAIPQEWQNIQEATQIPSVG